MKKRMFLCFSAALIFASGCDKNENEAESDGPQQPTSRDLVVKGTLPALTTTGTAQALTWGENDRIGLFVEKNTNIEMKRTGELTDNGAGASFTEKIEGELSDQTAYYLYYPYTFGTAIRSGKLGMQLGDQKYSEGKLPAMPMVAKYTGPANTVSATFHHVLTMLEIPVTKHAAMTDEVRVTSIRFSGNDNEKIAGNIFVDLSGDTFTADLSSTTERSITLDCGSAADGGVLLDATTPKKFYLCVAPGSYTKGYKLEIETSAGMQEAVISEDLAVTFGAGKLETAPAVEVAIIKEPVFTIPEQLYLYGTATENGGAGGQQFRKVSDGVFEIFTIFPQAGDICFKDGTEADAVNYYFDGTEIKQEAGTTPRAASVNALADKLVVDFNQKTITFTCLVRISFIWSATQDQVDFNHTAFSYMGNGILQIPNCLLPKFHRNYWWPADNLTEDERYYFWADINKPGEDPGSTFVRYLWGQDGNYENRPSIDEPAPANYPEINTTTVYSDPSTQQWTGCWKVPEHMVDKSYNVIINTNDNGKITHSFQEVK